MNSDLNSFTWDYIEHWFRWVQFIYSSFFVSEKGGVGELKNKRWHRVVNTLNIAKVAVDK